MLTIKMDSLDLERIATKINDAELSAKLYSAIYSNSKLTPIEKSSFDEKAFETYKKRIETLRYNEALEKITATMYKAIAKKQTTARLEVDAIDYEIYLNCVDNFTSQVKNIKLAKVGIVDRFKYQLSKEYCIYLTF